MWARVLSVVFHPLFIPTYFFWFLSRVLPTSLEPVSVALHTKFIIFIFLVTCAVPLINVAIFRMFRTVRSYGMPDRRERLMPFVFISLIYVIVTYLFHLHGRMNLNDNFMKFMVVIDMLVVIGTIATFFFKVSIHSLSVWGLIGMLVPLMKITEVNTLFYPTLGVIVLAGFVMAARLKTGVHNPREVMWGAVLGLATSVTGMVLLF